MTNEVKRIKILRKKDWTHKNTSLKNNLKRGKNKEEYENLNRHSWSSKGEEGHLAKGRDYYQRKDVKLTKEDWFSYQGKNPDKIIKRNKHDY